MDTTNNDNNLELGETPEETEENPFWALPPKAEILAASPDVRAILYAETLERIAAAGETAVDPGWLRAAVGVTSDLHAKHAPHLLKEAPEFAAKVKEGSAQLPTSGAAWHFFWKRVKKTSPIADAAVPSAETPAAADAPSDAAEPSDDAVVVVKRSLRSETRLGVVSSELMRQYEPPPPPPLLPETSTAEPESETAIGPAIEPPSHELDNRRSTDDDDQALARLEEAVRALGEATTISETKVILDLSVAAQAYFRQSRKSAEAIAAATNLRVRAERKLGQMLIQAKEAGKLREGRPRKTIENDDSFSLSDLGVTLDASSRAQKLAAIPHEEFERELSLCGNDSSSTIARLLKKARPNIGKKGERANAPGSQKPSANSTKPAPPLGPKEESQPEAFATPPPAFGPRDEVLSVFPDRKIVAPIPGPNLSKDFSVLKPRCEEWLRAMQVEFPSFTLHEIALACDDFAVKLMYGERRAS